ncbi:MAG TPA: LCP family protein [Acidimicrobiales bacterium]|nr:LCP family protein [Acidimicrobiales bacterium]
MTAAPQVDLARPAHRTRRETIRRQRRRRRHIVITTIVVLCIVNISVGGIYAYLRWRLGQIDRVTAPSLDDDTGETMNVLLVGSDSRARLSGEQAAQAGKGEVAGERTDTIMIVHIDPGAQRAVLVSIPRDLYLPIAGTSRSDRVNSAYSLGGAPTLIETVQQGLGVKINHYAEVDFVGFQGIVDAVGGITVYVPAPARDAYSGLEIGSPGCISFDGNMALAWVRSRYFEYQTNGQWIQDPRSDLGRIQRQQDFIRRTLRKAVSSGLSNPLTFNRLLAIATANLTVDSGMSTSDITTLARRFRSLDPDAVETRTLPTTDVTINGADVLTLNREEAQLEIDALNGIEPPPSAVAVPPAGGVPTSVPDIPAANVRVRVLNGTGVEGRAAKAAAALKSAGFTIAGTGDSDDSPTAETVILFRPGAIARAQVAAAALESPAQLLQDPTVRNADVVVVLGTSDKGVRAGAADDAAAAATTTTTTAPPEPTPVPSGAPAKTC